VALSLNNLAELHDTTGAYAKALPLYQRSLAIREKALGPAHPDVAQSLNNLAVLYSTTGAYAKAEPLFQRALAIWEKTLGPTHPDVALPLNNLAELYGAIGAYAKAEPLYQRSLAIKEKALGPHHPDVALSLNNLAALEVAQRRYPSAISLLKRALAIEDRKIRDIFTFTTEEQKLTFMESISAKYIYFLSLIHQHFGDDRAVVRDGLELVLRRKGIVFDAQSRAREALQKRLSEAARTEWDRLSAFRGELSQVLLHKQKTMTPAQYQEKLASLQQQIEQSEQRLAKESALVAKELRQRTTTVAAIWTRLPITSALVEFVKIEDFDFVKNTWSSSSRYLAFILPVSGDVSLVDLGDATALESQVRRALQSIKVSMESRDLKVHKKADGLSSNQEDVQSLRDLYQRVWSPLRQALGSADQVVISPDGLLNLVPFAALVDDKGRALVESTRLTYVSSGRELVVAEGAGLKPESDLLLVANPAFDGAVQKSNSPEASLRSRDFQGDFSPLPGTEREAKEIPPLIKGQGDRQQVLVGRSATEQVVKTTRSPHILHLATHGFFLQDEEIVLGEGTRDLKVTKSAIKAPPKQQRHENPLVRSGLAFAGANNASEITEGDDGILTALEITGMDLYGTELVVLSACNTGVGEIKTGEGVFGLRRAFALAGAKNLLMSLWPVSDEITANQMKAFYRNLQTMPPADALRQAQLQTIKELTAEEGSASPALWAPFILQGGQALGQ
jgi:CHAT domain-containing protein